MAVTNLLNVISNPASVAASILAGGVQNVFSPKLNKLASSSQASSIGGLTGTAPSVLRIAGPMSSAGGLVLSSLSNSPVLSPVSSFNQLSNAIGSLSSIPSAVSSGVSAVGSGLGHVLGTMAVGASRVPEVAGGTLGVLASDFSRGFGNPNPNWFSPSSDPVGSLLPGSITNLGSTSGADPDVQALVGGINQLVDTMGVGSVESTSDDYTTMVDDFNTLLGLLPAGGGYYGGGGMGYSVENFPYDSYVSSPSDSGLGSYYDAVGYAYGDEYYPDWQYSQFVY